MFSDIIPPNRLLTVALVLGLAALIVYGAVNRDPATIVIVVALALFFSLPALATVYLNRRRRGQDSSLPPHSDDTPPQ